MARMAAAAINAGFDVDVISLRRSEESREESVDGVTVLRTPVEHKRGAEFCGVLYEYLAFTVLATLMLSRRMFQRRYDVVHVHNPPDFLVVAGLIPKLLGARLVFDVHDLASDMFTMRFGTRRGAGLVQLLLRLVQRFAIRTADVVITVHEPYRKELLRAAPRADIRVVMNSLDERLLPPTARRPRGFMIAYHGTVTPSYGVHLIVGAMAKIGDRASDARLEIFGEGDALDEVLELARSHGIADRVNATGRYLPHADVLAAIRSASVGVIPNMPTRLNRFALSSKLFEYVAMRIPVVVADLPTLRAHFSDHEVRFFRAGDEHALAEALLDIYRDPIAAEKRARLAQIRYEEYRWAQQASRYIELLGTGEKTKFHRMNPGGRS